MMLRSYVDVLDDVEKERNCVELRLMI